MSIGRMGNLSSSVNGPGLSKKIFTMTHPLLCSSSHGNINVPSETFSKVSCLTNGNAFVPSGSLAGNNVSLSDGFMGLNKLILR